MASRTATGSVLLVVLSKVANERDPAIALPGGWRVTLRPAKTSDRAQLREGFARLSRESRYRRFLSPHNELSPGELCYFTEVDHHRHEALVALDADTGQRVGIARYVQSAVHPQLAELAVAVVDDWLGRGVRTALLLALLERAREAGIRSFSALVLQDNVRMLNLLEELGQPRVVEDEFGSVELKVDLPDQGLGDLAHLLRSAARGRLAVRHPRDPRLQGSRSAVKPNDAAEGEPQLSAGRDW
jgi:GNAT superfamily N-acetyltransferase